MRIGGPNLEEDAARFEQHRTENDDLPPATSQHGDWAQIGEGMWAAPDLVRGRMRGSR